MSMNCRGLGNVKKRRDVLHFLNEKQPDILCLQDVHFTKEVESQVKTEWGDVCFFSHGTSNSRGVAILFKDTIDVTIHDVMSDPSGNWLALDFTFEYMRFTLMSIYGPNTDQPEFYDHISEIINSFENAHTIICGDWNLTLNPDMDNKNYVKINNPKSRERVLRLMEEMELADAWRLLHPNTKRFTWRQHNPLKQGRLDFFVISNELLSLLDTCKIDPGYRTDHSLISLTFIIQTQTDRKSYWKFNKGLLKDEEYVRMVKTEIKEVLLQYAASPYERDAINNIPISELFFSINDALLFETLLLGIRGKTIAFASRRKKERNEREKELERIIGEIENNIDEQQSGPEMEKRIQELNIKKGELQQLRSFKMEGLMIRSRAQIIEQGEKPSAFFLNLEKKKNVNKYLNKLIDETGSEITENKKIIENVEIYYKKVYKNRDNKLDLATMETFFTDDSVQKLTKKQRVEIEGPLTYSEILKVLKNMTNNKSPGQDGFSAEFFKFFWLDIGTLLVRMLNCVYENGLLSQSQQLGVITLIPKPNKPRYLLKNWRPISLLNITYKLASGCIANRIKNVLSHIISREQNGFMPGRFIGENSRLMSDLISVSEQLKIPGMLLLIDFEKAFDSVSHKFIYKALEMFNFGTSIKRWIKIFYSEMFSSININGCMSKRFKVERGCRQGDPLSPYIFLLCAELLNSLIKKNKNIKGMKINDVEYLMSQYADDTTIVLDGSERSLHAILDTLDTFEKMSGLRINEEKTKAVWIGSKRGCEVRIKTRKKLTG